MKKMNEDQLAEKFIKEKGWKKFKGYKIHREEINDASQEDWEFFHIHKDDLVDYVEKIEFWQSEAYEETCFEEVDDVIDFIEEHDDGNWEEWFASHNDSIDSKTDSKKIYNCSNAVKDKEE